MILGITGKNAAGKGEVASYFRTKGFVYHSLSDIIREEATKRGIEHTRDNLINLGNELREKFGHNFLAKKTLKKINNQKNFARQNFFVVDSIRNPEEINELRKVNQKKFFKQKFFLIAVEAPIELRFERMKQRGRLGDAKTVGQLNEQEEKENLKKDSNQQLDKCIEMADYIIVNDGALEELHKKIDELLLNLTN